ncbi:MAG: rRNA maturation RNase YbeY [Calditrichota bacterium]
MTNIEVLSDHPTYKPDLTAMRDTVRSIQDAMELSAIELIIIFVDDAHLQNLHSTYLDDDSLTDIMTFNLSDDDVEGEIYISVDRARDNAAVYDVNYEQELCRLIIHGLLHLNGHDDASPAERQKMRELEDFHLTNSLPEDWLKTFTHQAS